MRKQIYLVGCHCLGMPSPLLIISTNVLKQQEELAHIELIKGRISQDFPPSEKACKDLSESIETLSKNKVDDIDPTPHHPFSKFMAKGYRKK